MQKIFLVNRFYYPDLTATSQMSTDLASGLAGENDITVITSRAVHDEPLTRLESREDHLGVRVLRLSTIQLGRSSILGRAFGYLTFHVRVVWCLLSSVNRGDVVVLMTDPPLLSLINTAAIKLRGGRVVNWLQDLFPEAAVELGAFPRNRVISRPLIAWRNRALRAAAINVVISEPMRACLAEQGITATRVIPNWANGHLIRRVDHAENPLRREWGLENRFVVAYSGNFGRAHSFQELCEAMALLANRDDIHFLLIGDGVQRRNLEQFAESRQLKNVTFLPLQPRENLANSLSAADLHLVTLKPEMENLVTPSKLYGAFAAGRPVAFVGDAGSAIAELVRGQEVGVSFGHGDGAGLASAIAALSSDPGRCRQMGLNARRLFEARYNYQQGLAEWMGLFTGLGKGAAAPERS